MHMPSSPQLSDPYLNINTEKTFFTNMYSYTVNIQERDWPEVEEPVQSNPDASPPSRALLQVTDDNSNSDRDIDSDDTPAESTTAPSKEELQRRIDERADQIARNTSPQERKTGSVAEKASPTAAASHSDGDRSTTEMHSSDTDKNRHDDDNTGNNGDGNDNNDQHAVSSIDDDATEPPPMQPYFYRVTYDYASNHPQDLSLKKGDYVVQFRGRTGISVEARTTGFIFGQANSKQGFFPLSYLEPVTGPFSVCRILWSWHNDRQQDLELVAGSHVIRIHRNDQEFGWWFGYSNGMMGNFPLAFAYLCKSLDAPHSTEWINENVDQREHWFELGLSLRNTQSTIELSLASLYTAMLSLHMQINFDENIVIIGHRGPYKTWKAAVRKPLDTPELTFPRSGRFVLKVTLGDAAYLVHVNGALFAHVPHLHIIGSDVGRIILAGGAEIEHASCSWKKYDDEFLSDFVDQYESMRVGNTIPHLVRPFPDNKLLTVEQRRADHKAAGHNFPLSKAESHYRLFVGVLSVGKNFANRQAARLTWMRYPAFASRRVVARFFLAQQPGHPEVTQRVKEEAEKYGDIVIAPFIDHYLNLSRKTKAICEYYVNAVDADYMMKVDDDTFVRIPEILERLKQVDSSKELYMGSIVMRSVPSRDKTYKWYMPESEWPFEYYPPFAHGPGYLLSRKLAEVIVEAHMQKKLRLLRLEDIAMGSWVEYAREVMEKEVDLVPDNRFHIFLCAEDMIIGHYISPAYMFPIFWRDIQALPNMCV
jgi:Galactosyltransferase/Variant SH3 domain/Galactoside-binding lectin